MTAAAICTVGRVTRLAMSVHEAGHAFVAWSAGAPVHRMWLERPARGWSGFVFRDMLDDPDEARIALAGPIAEHAWFIRNDANENVSDRAEEYGRICMAGGYGIEDFTKAHRHIAALAVDDPLATFCALWRETSALLEKHWDAVVGLGRALSDAGELDGKEITAALEGTAA